MFSEYQLSLRFSVSYAIDHRHLSKKATLVYSTNSNKKTICPLKNFQTPPTVFLSLSLLLPLSNWIPQTKPWYFLNPCHFYSLTLSFISFKSNSRNQTLLSLSYPNSLPSTIASSIFSLPQCSSFTYGASSHSHYRASLVQREQSLYPLKITFTLFLASSSIWRTRAIFSLTDSEAQPPKRVIFPFYLFRFSTFSHLLFHFLIFLQL